MPFSLVQVYQQSVNDVHKLKLLNQHISFNCTNKFKGGYLLLCNSKLFLYNTYKQKISIQFCGHLTYEFSYETNKITIKYCHQYLRIYPNFVEEKAVGMGSLRSFGSNFNASLKLSTAASM